MKQLPRVILLLFLLFAGAFLSSIGYSAPPQAESQPKSQNEGEKLFQANCGRCHNAPVTLSPREARTVIRHMRVRANLSEEDARLILQYLSPITVESANTPTITAAPPHSPRQVNITAMQFSFMPNEITLKKGEPVTLVLTSLDVTHGLKIEGLDVTIDEIKKGRFVQVDVTPREAGQFQGVCAHLCGTGHGAMILTVNVVE